MNRVQKEMLDTWDGALHILRRNIIDLHRYEVRRQGTDDRDFGYLKQVLRGPAGAGKSLILYLCARECYYCRMGAGLSYMDASFCPIVHCYNEEEFSAIVKYYIESKYIPTTKLLPDTELRDIFGHVPRLLVALKRTYVDNFRVWDSQVKSEVVQSILEYTNELRQ